MELILLLRKDWIGMSKKVLTPKGRKSIPPELMQFGKHLVYAEGTKTEPNYINEIKSLIANKYNCRPNEIQIVIANENNSRNTVGLVQFMIEDVTKRAKNEKINHVWVMFDRDDFPKDNFDNAIKKIESLNNSENQNEDSFHYNTKDLISYHACYSNECFELWLILHFEYLSSQLTRQQYYDKLGDYLKQTYDKTTDDVLGLILKNGGSIDNAIKYAKKLVETNQTSNPSTAMYLFAEYFKPYMK